MKIGLKNIKILRINRQYQACLQCHRYYPYILFFYFHIKEFLGNIMEELILLIHDSSENFIKEIFTKVTYLTNILHRSLSFLCSTDRIHRWLMFWEGSKLAVGFDQIVCLYRCEMIHRRCQSYQLFYDLDKWMKV